MTDPSAVGKRDGTTHSGAADEPPLDPGALAFLSRPGLSRLWAAARTRLERGGLEPTGTIRLPLVDPQEREALSLLLAKPLTGPSATISLPELDARLRISAVGRGLAATLTALGPPLTDRRAARDAATAERDRLWSAAEAALAATSLADQPWADRWLTDIRRSGTFTRRPPTTALTTLTQAIQALATLHPGSGPAPVTWGRGELATRTTGSAHGLDDGTLLARLVLRGIALAQDVDFPTDAPARRALWRRASVTPDEVSSTVLTYGLRPTGTTWQETALRERADRHLETHLTLRELRTLHRHLKLPSRTRVHVCENPRVVEAAADAGRTAPLICTSGSATTVVLTLLDTLAATDCAFVYHGDFDWPGITLANRVMERYGAEPWRMGAPDYEYLATRAELHGTPPLPLSGTSVEATWDTELAATMDALGLALHEEAALDLLLEDLE
ncbi:TIGR02679 family protein [Streptomyces brasiliscabiei]|uniref:TIGR02679 family protein n=1 Tax=Streptomyces brasiliscabiei TaxID=2736302 RepID=A0ABU8GE79_9ACTN